MAYAAQKTSAAEEATDKPAHKPPSLETRVGWVEDTLLATVDGRNLQALGERYYYGDQWTEAELADLKTRGQPPIVDNLIRRKVNTVRGEEIEKRVDPVAKPRTPKHEAAGESKAITDALRYVEEDQDIDGVGADALLDGMNTGLLAAIVEADSEDGYRCTAQHIPWTQVVIDYRSRRRDCMDARFISNVQWFDLEDAIANPDYAHAEEALRSACGHHIGAEDDTTEDRPKQWFDGKRKRVKIVEMYYRDGKDWYRSDFTSGIDLRDCEPSAYLDPRTKRPWCPIIVRRVYVDHENQAHGPVRDMISPQDEVNKRKSKSLHLLSVDQMHYEEGALLDPTAAHIQRTRPDANIVYQPGALQEGRVRFERNLDLVQGQVLMLQEAKQALEAVGGASATLPDLPQSSSGIAFARRQKAASREMGPVFESFRNFREAIYWHVWGCIKQFWTDEMWLRVTDDEETAGYRWVGLNRRMTRGQRLQELLQKGVPLPTALQSAAGDEAQGVIQRVQQMHRAMTESAIAFGQEPPGGDEHMLQMILQDEAMGVQVVENNVAEAMVDITIHESTETATLREEEFGKLLEATPTILQTSPQLAPFWTELLIQFSDFQEKKKMLEKLQQPPDPQQAQVQQAMQQIQVAGAQAGVQVQQTQAQLNAARAASEQAKAQQAGVALPSEIQKNQASAIHDTVMAGIKMGSGGMPQGV